MTTEKKRIVCVIGTRPEAIKMAPLIWDLKERAWADVCVVNSGQHRELMTQTMEFLGIKPQYDLDVMLPNQTLPKLTARLIEALDRCFDEVNPRCVMAVGDTTTAMTSALASFYRQLPFAHIEAGLRSFDPYSPFPEEMNRIIASRMARWHFSPTEGNKLNLLREGISDSTIFVTGNTVIDALLRVAKNPPPLPVTIPSGARLILVTTHRRENFGEPLRNIAGALRQLADEYKDVHIVFPMHPNPNVRTVVNEMLGNHERIQLIQPASYEDFIALMLRSHLILTDSGGLQEEAPALGKPVILLRRETERPEAIAAGGVLMAGTDKARILELAKILLDSETEYRRVATPRFPYGEGKASERILSVLENDLL